MNKLNELLRNVFTVGTPQCGVAGAVIGVVLAVLLLSIGLWKTLFIALFALIGAVWGGVKSKRSLLRNIINRCFPEKRETAVDTYEQLKNK